MQIDPQGCPHLWEYRVDLLVPPIKSKRDKRYVFVCLYCTAARIGDRQLPRRARPLRAKAAEMDDFVVRQHDRRKP